MLVFEGKTAMKLLVLGGEDVDLFLSDQLVEKPHVKDPSKFERFDSSTDGKNAPKSQHLNSMYVKILVVVVYFQCSPQKLGEDVQFDEHIFQRGGLKPPRNSMYVKIFWHQ